MKVAVSHRVEDSPKQKLPQTPCTKCGNLVYVEGGPEGIVVCIHCADPNEVVFVELPPDEYGRRSMAKSVAEVLAKGDWHKEGTWHSQQWALSNIE